MGPAPASPQARRPLRERQVNTVRENEKMRVPSDQLRQLRHAMSEQTLCTRRLETRASTLDLLNREKITSFGELRLHIVDDYFPASTAVVQAPLEPSNPSWQIIVQKKMRWRWRLSKLLPEN